MGNINNELDRDPLLVATDDALTGRDTFRKFQKRVPTSARQMDKPFKVETTEGVMEGKAGDYLCLDTKGNPYPCAREVFEESYEEVTNG